MNRWKLTKITCSVPFFSKYYNKNIYVLHNDSSVTELYKQKQNKSKSTLGLNGCATLENKDTQKGLHHILDNKNYLF